ncbi:hypothetical protein [Chitinophaga japonensis]|uniref:Uncharacterized protein n=1 Tax=Chitinophaga japonensis TaxID=104662 RepID=A0A562SKY6_CHIJA|nr:hypothetical protein [Chitinophaga japonensis]TWI81981.1 hypothetical protein LX66_5297 [Chitinophaga japonensis]
MKHIFSLLLLLSPVFLYSQTFKIRIGGAAGQELDISAIPATLTFPNGIGSFEIKKEPADNPAQSFRVVAGNTTLTFPTDGDFHPLSFPADIREIDITINDAAGAVTAGPFRLHKSPEDTGGGADGEVKIDMPTDKTATEYLVNTLFKDQIYDTEDVGLKLLLTSRNSRRTSRYMGHQYIHLFFDQHGNSLIRSIPLGVGKDNYVVHVVYLVPKENPLRIEYRAVQNTADIEEGTVIRGDGDLQNSLRLQHLDPDKKTVTLEWAHTETLFTPSSFDINFDIVRNAFQLKGESLEVTSPVVVASKVIKVKKIYHGSIDVGVLKTSLENPTFMLTASDADPNLQVIKRTNSGSRVLASAMYTFYLSPVVLIEKLLMPEKVRNYKLEGRSFADDHKIYERIYPTVGIGLNDRLLDNIFLGGKWEFIRGGSVFLGYHWGKVNTLETEPGFEFEKTEVSQAAFDLKTNMQWKGAFCFGLNLDVRIIANLFQATAAR